MSVVFSYVPVDNLDGRHPKVKLLKSAPTRGELLADTTYDPHQSGSHDAAGVTDTGTRCDVTDSLSGDIVAAAVCRVE
jgi:transposase InsO family protein